jgi:ferritin-like metal-binding protein YciE
MKGAVMELRSLEDVFAEQIGDLRSAEEQLIEALPRMAEAAHDPELKAAFTDHLEETKEHLRRLDDVALHFGFVIPKKEKTTAGMEGLLREGDELTAAAGEPAARDAALIAAAQRVEHYEIAAYGTAKAIANELGHASTAQTLTQTLDEEAHADKRLTKLATGGLFSSGINREAGPDR